jgi:choline-sulfatase
MTDQPDIIWLYCDELRCDAVGCYGIRWIQPHTPNLDRLAASGVRFVNNFCNSPVCVSSRCCVLGGLYPEDTGIYNNEAAWRHFRLPRPIETFPRVFARQGYGTANFGKIHVCRGMYPGECPDGDIFQYHDGTGGEMNFWERLDRHAAGAVEVTRECLVR